MNVREQIAEVLNTVGLGCEEFDPNDLDSGCPDCGDLLRYADALVPLVFRLRTEAAAEAWDEGHRTGWQHCQDGEHGPDHWDDQTPNPYAEGEN